jgi:hypothetical protein
MNDGCDGRKILRRGQRGREERRKKGERDGEKI